PRAESDIYRLHFGHAETYRKANESWRWAYKWPEPSQGERSWPLYIVENSSWIAQLSKDSCDFFPSDLCKHYLVLTAEFWIEVLTVDEPVLSRLSRNSADGAVGIVCENLEAEGEESGS
ncbi:MAG: hypothetical protein AAF772_21490, partial [Acidobacteriota bacterium]